MSAGVPAEAVCRVGRDPADQARQHPAGAELDEAVDAQRGHRQHAFPPAHGGRHLLHQHAGDLGRVGDAGGGDIGDQRHRRFVRRRGRERLGHGIGRRRHQRAMEGCRDRQQHGPADAARLRRLDAALHRRARARYHHLAAAVVVCHVEHLARAGQRIGCRLVADRLGHVALHAEQGGHRPLAQGDRRLHRRAAPPQQPRRLGEGETAGGGQRGIFAERMPGHHHGAIGQHEARLALDHPQHGDRMRHQRRLGVLGEGELFGRALEHQPRQLLPQRVVDLLEHLARGGEGGREIAPHADRLAALAGEDERVHRHVDRRSLGRAG